MPKARGYPIGALFVLVSVCAVLAAGVSPLARSEPGGVELDQETLWTIGLGAFSGLICGAILGAMYYRFPMGMLMGIAAGTAIGSVAGAMALIPGNQLVTAAAAMTAGSALVVGVAVLMRRANE
jgi:hypothetical protein